MLPKRLINGFNKRGLQQLLLLIFLALCIPTVVLIWQAYGQLKWEAFHQYRVAAEELSERIDTRLNAMINSVDAHKFADYAFLVVSGDPSANLVQRSPLSTYPVEGDVPGVIGYFQVDTQGVFTTPLIPPAGTESAALGISDLEFERRLRAAAELQSVLADNRLLRSRQDVDLERRLSILNSSLSSPATVAAMNVPVESERTGSGRLNSEDELSVDVVEESDGTVLVDEAPAGSAYRQEVFDDLNEPRKKASYEEFESQRLEPAFDRVDDFSQNGGGRKNIGKVSDIKLDADLQKKSEMLERKDSEQRLNTQRTAVARERRTRKEVTALPESATLAQADRVANLQAPADIRISTFESEIDPFEFSLLDSGHFVLYRKVWRDGERYIQGVLIEQDAFVQNVFGERFMETALSDMSSLIIAYQDDVILKFGGRNSRGYSNVVAELSGELLFRSRFGSPFGNLESIFSLRHLPAGPGANVLAWVTLVLAVVFVVGFLILYRLGLSQISLTGQQQDFVSAVSHELKSPLTSIRMYGEMLKEGWADEDKRQTYYEFIHDESERLSRLISNILQLASITRNEPQFDAARVTVAELMSNTESKISSQIERAGFELRINRAANAEKATIDIDEDCFAQIIINLVDNAIKFSKNADSKTIEIGSKLAGDGKVTFSVRDYGPGIAKDQMKKIFQLFYRSESELTRETVGTGIGLAIVHQLTSAMNGSVDLVNANPGAEFNLRFPITTR